jgi:stage II sporulation protein D
VRDTAGEVLLLGGAIVDARYSASCGGTTAAFGDVFAEPLAGSAAMVARRCAPGAVERPWEARVDAAALAALWTELGLGTSAKRLAVTARDAHGRWLEVELAAGGKRRAMSAAELRQRLGAALVKSTRIERCVPPLGTPIEGDLTLAGTGFGHGVGLCQAGARALAESGADAAAILAHYYPEARAERLRVAAAGTEPQ